MKRVLQIVIIATSALVAFTGCKSRELNTQFSNTTGWNYYDEKTTNFEAKEGVGNVDPIGMVAIQGGTFNIGQTDEFVTAPRDNARRSITVSSFYMDKYEITNLNWREYMHWLEMVFGYSAPNLVRAALPDTLVWRDELAYNEPYVENYFRHPAFSFYPVVGISWDQAMEYCNWRTDRVNELALVRVGAIEFPDFKELAPLDEMVLEDWRNANPGYEILEIEKEDENNDVNVEYRVPYEWIRDKFVFNTEKYLVRNDYNPVNPNDNRIGKKFHDAWGNARKVDRTDGILVVGYRLPTEAEWEFAAFAPIAGEDGLTIEGKAYPWSGYHPRDLSKKNMGMMQANFIRGKGDMMGVSGMLNDGYVITNPVDAFAPNDFGLYNMAGNVNEWVMDVYRETTYQDVTEYNSFRGNIYKKAKRNENGEFVINALGGIDVEWSGSDDKRDYLDGDFASLIQTDYPLDTLGALFLKGLAANSEGNGSGDDEDSGDEGDGDEDEGDDEGDEDEDGGDDEGDGGDDGAADANKKIDPTDIYAPKITKTTHVYKGGSWNDRAYWLHPSSRRYLEGNKSKSTLGFRCAMSTLGDQIASGPNPNK